MTTIREDRPFDMIVYGATGYTGKRVAKYINEQHPNIRLAISGRSPEKLSELAKEMNLSASSVHVAPISADPDDNDDINTVTNNSILVDALKQSKLVLACAGPYRTPVGNALVSAAIAARTDYLDLCGEPQFFDDMLVKHDAAARDAGILIVSACAFDCVPAELSYRFASRHFYNDGKEEEEDAVLNGVEIVHTFQNVKCANATTFHAAVDGFHAASTGELSKSRKAVTALYADALSNPPPKAPPLPSNISRSQSSTVTIPSPPSSKSILPAYHPYTDTHVVKFVGADAACILASERYLRIRNYQDHPNRNSHDNATKTLPTPKLSVLLSLPTKSAAYKLLSYGAVFSTLAKYQWGCKLLHSNPELFTNHWFRDGGPTEEELKDGTFVTHAAAYGTISKKGAQGEREVKCVRTRCRGPEPGYVATPKILVGLARTLLKEREERVGMVFESGVVLPGALFGECDLAYQCLKEEGVVFEVVSDDDQLGGGGGDTVDVSRGDDVV